MHFPMLEANILYLQGSVSDWFILFFVSVVIGWSYYSGFGFTTLI